MKNYDSKRAFVLLIICLLSSPWMILSACSKNYEKHNAQNRGGPVENTLFLESEVIEKNIKEDTSGSDIIIGATLASDDSSYLISVTEYMLAEAKEQNIQLILQYAQWDANLQSEQMNAFIEQQVDAIILCPINAKAMLTPLKRADEAGIPVINLNMKVDGISSEYISTYVGASSSEEAALAAEVFIELLEDDIMDNGFAGGKIAIIEGAPGSDAQIYRTQTFIEQLASHPAIEIAGIGNGRWDRDQAKLVAIDLLRRNPDIVGIFCHDSNMAIGAIEAVEMMGFDHEIYIVGISEDEEYFQAVAEQRLYGLITQPPEYEGRQSIRCALEAANGELLRPWYKDSIEIVTYKNINNYIE